MNRVKRHSMEKDCKQTGTPSKHSNETDAGEIKATTAGQDEKHSNENPDRCILWSGKSVLWWVCSTTPRRVYFALQHPVPSVPANVPLPNVAELHHACPARTQTWGETCVCVCVWSAEVTDESPLGESP